jgi:hypothetical protein
MDGVWKVREINDNTIGWGQTYTDPFVSLHVAKWLLVLPLQAFFDCV